MALKPDIIAPCDVKVGTVMAPGFKKLPQHRCEAFYVDLATGLKFSKEMGLPANQRTEIISQWREATCARLIDEGRCSAIILPVAPITVAPNRRT